MARITYTPKKFKPDTLAVIQQANAICAQYAAQNLSLTLRQLYYQFVARGLLPNKQSEYKRLGSILNDARMAGAMDWDYLVDRTRNLVELLHFNDPADRIQHAARAYRTDLWEPQHRRVEVWIEKDAAIGVIEAVCQTNDVPYFSCRGYTSVSEIWAGAQRLGEYIRAGEAVTILHIGDHDPSGIDMSRDIEKRLHTFITQDWLDADPNQTFMGAGMGGGTFEVTHDEVIDDMQSTLDDPSLDPFEIKRIALTYAQVLQYAPPPNPAKQTDARYQQYVRDTGLTDSWELDALDPVDLQNLVQDEIDLIRDQQTWDDAVDEQEDERALLTKTSRHWPDVAAFVAAKP